MSDYYPITLSHFLVFPEVMREPRLCQRFLEKVLDIKIRKLEFIQTEKAFKESRTRHGIRLDVYVEDDADSVYDVEMQNSIESLKRVRYYQSGIDRQILKSGAFYTQLKTSFIIMVCNYDPTHVKKDPKDPASREIPGLAYPMYKRESVMACPVGSTVYDDGSHAVFLNTRYDPKYREDMPEVCEFLDLINEKRDISPEALKYPLAQMAAEGITRFRQNEEKREEIMTLAEYLKEQEYKAREEGKMDGVTIGREEGREEGEAIGIEKSIQKLMKAQNLTREEAEKILL